MNKRKLIVNADDFGQSEGINEGIIQSHENGIVRSASLMVRYPYATDAARYAINNPSLGVGLHIDLGEWTYDGKEWVPLYEVVPLDDIQAVEMEVKNQLKMFIQMVGKNPTHIDSHQHVHKRENLRPVLEDIARALNITLRGCSNHVQYCGDFYGQAEDGTELREAISPEGLNRIISTLPEGVTEMACHPAIKLDIHTMYGTEREQEVRSLCEVAIYDKIKSENIELCNFNGITF